MDNIKRRILTRETGLWTDFFLFAAIMPYLFWQVGLTLGEYLSKVTGIQALFQTIWGDAVARFAEIYLDFIGVWIIALLFMWVFKPNRPMLSCLSFGKGGRGLCGAGIGLVLGFLANGVCILIAWLMGDIHLEYNGFQPGVFLLFFLFVAIQSGSEEIMNRCYLYQKIRRGYKEPWMAIGLNAFAFMAMHLGNSGINTAAKIQIVEVGVLFSLFVYYYDSLWMAIMMHTAWNYTQSILFGLPNSGLVSAYSLFRLEASTAKDGLFYNVNFGVEGTVGALIVNGILIAVILFKNYGKGEKRDLWAKADQNYLTGRETI